MVRRFGFVALLVCGLLAVGAGGAIAQGTDRAEGHFTTREGAVVDFIANIDRSGKLSYDDGTLSITCDGYTSYVADTTRRGKPRVTVGSDTCFDVSGMHVILKAQFVDRRSRTRRDRATILFTDDNGRQVAFTSGRVRGDIQIT
jgi:hypothetical protein